MREFTVSVRELVQFCHRSGDIDHRFSPSPTGMEGIEGHQKVQSRRGAGYLPEHAVEYRYLEGEMPVLLRGRADGFDPDACLVEEIKTCRTPFAKIPQAVTEMHFAQGRLYAAMIAERESLTQLSVRLTWFNIDTEEEHRLEQSYSSAQLREFLQLSLARFAAWITLMVARRRERDAQLSGLEFPMGSFRPGQREIAELVYKCIDQSGQLMIEAPTGIGKTAAVLYPALKALASGKHERIVFATAKTVGRRAAEEALQHFGRDGYIGSSLSMTAKERICLSPGSACHAEDCAYARGYYDRREGAMNRAVQQSALDTEKLTEIAQAFSVCPYQLSLDMLPWVDLVIADYHYLFSLTSGLVHWSRDEEERWTVLVDEAHNLPSRARGMYRARLAKSQVMQGKKNLPAKVKRAVEKINRRLLALQKEPWVEPDFDSREETPAELLHALSDFVFRMGEAMTEDPVFLQRHPETMDLYFDIVHFLRVAENWGEEFRCELTQSKARQSLVVTLNCLDPSRLLSARHSEIDAICLFSATLSPQHWCRQSLGLRDEAVISRQASPFATEQMQVYLDTTIDTRYRQRKASLPALVSQIDQWLTKRAGNCIVYFPSYRYMQDTLTALEETGSDYGQRELWVQGSQAGDREGLLGLVKNRTDIAAFCILGGVFGEGIDLPGDQLASVIVVGVGLPQVNRDTEQQRLWHQARNRQGFEFAYLYPGMQKVDQALGRVIRSEKDAGEALLLDSRYEDPVYRDLLPTWWSYSRSE